MNEVKGKSERMKKALGKLKEILLNKKISIVENIQSDLFVKKIIDDKITEYIIIPG